MVGLANTALLAHQLFLSVCDLHYLFDAFFKHSFCEILKIKKAH